jgi:hypothetical protein
MSADPNRDPAEMRNPEEVETRLIAALDGYWEALQRGEAADPERWAGAHPEGVGHLEDLRLVGSLYDALALTDADGHALAVDVGDLEADEFGDAQAGGVEGHEDGPGFEPAGRGEQPADLVAAEDDGELLLFLLADDAVQGPVAVEGDAVEEAQGTADLVEGARRDVAVVDEVEQVGADLLRAELIRGPLVVPGELGDGPEVGVPGVGGEVAHLHVFEHALPERGHGGLLERRDVRREGSLHHDGVRETGPRQKGLPDVRLCLLRSSPAGHKAWVGRGGVVRGR